jgi:choline dehydrogenase-like flavoprotein
MILDAKELASNTSLTTQVCIVGGGVAGITLALELAKSKIKVMLLESGGLEFDSQTQSLYRGKNIGKKYYTLDTSRIRFFGGTSNHWGGNCRELEEIDFKKRDWIEHSGWPITKNELGTYYKRAKHYCQLNPHKGFQANDWESSELVTPTTSSDAKINITQFAPSTFGNEKFIALSFGDAYLAQIKNSPYITLVLHANVTKIVKPDTKNTIDHVNIKRFDGTSIKIKAQHFTLAAGGIENARLLLVSKHQDDNGLGNQHDLVGRYFMEHIGINLGVMVPSKKNMANYDMLEVPNRRVLPKAQKHERTKAFITLSERTLTAAKMLNTSVTISREHLPASHKSRAYRSLRTLIENAKHGEFSNNIRQHLRNVLTGLDDVAHGVKWKLFHLNDPVELYRIHLQAEQAPNPHSRVTLSNEKDKLGIPQVNLNWQLTEQDLDTVRKTALEMAIEMGKSGLGRVIIDIPESNKELYKQIKGDWHHMGTTRMHESEKQGVVDPNCKVHGIDNLFIAGSSVFPTGGHSVPTFTITALSIRLADHIKEILA